MTQSWQRRQYHQGSLTVQARVLLPLQDALPVDSQSNWSGYMAMANARIVTPMLCHAVMVPFAIVAKNSENQETLWLAGP